MGLSCAINTVIQIWFSHTGKMPKNENHLMLIMFSYQRSKFFCDTKKICNLQYGIRDFYIGSRNTQ